MEINVHANIHNKFEIHIRDINTGEITQKGYAENIVLNHLLSHPYFGGSSNYCLSAYVALGRGTGVLDPTRTSLFNKIGTVFTADIESNFNLPPTPSYITRKGTIGPTIFVGETFTEIGLTNATFYPNNVFTHALIKDSEGNPLALGPKTDTQEVIIYSTVYFTLSLPLGITIAGGINPLVNNFNGIIAWGLLMHTNIRQAINEMRWYTNLDSTYLGSKPYVHVGGNKYASGGRLETTSASGKLKTLVQNSTVDIYGTTCFGLSINLVTLAQNNSPIWSGHHFVNTLIGVGDGVKTVFNLPWDEARLDKPKVVYLNGIETAVTWAAGSVTFASPPANLLEVKGDYWVDYIPKDSNRVVDFSFNITFGEGAA